MKNLPTSLRKWIVKSIPIVGLFIVLLSILALSPFSNENQLTTSNQFFSNLNLVQKSDSLILGEVWTGEPGITLTVDEIMQKEAMLPADYYLKSRPKTNPEFEIERLEKEQNPEAPDVSQWPPRNEEQKYQEPPNTDNPQTIGASFLGPTLSLSGFVPPDSQGDVGPTQVLTCANGRIRVYSKTGVLGGLNADLNVFFSSVHNGAGTTDPHIRYDRLSERWFVVIVSYQIPGPNRVLIARSSSSTITNTSSFTFFQFTQDAVGVPGDNLNGFADYPTLGVDKFALYIGVNIFSQNVTANVGTTGFVVNKANLIAGTLTVTAFRQLADFSPVVDGPYTPQGVDNDDPSATEGYFIGVSLTNFSRLIIRRVTNPGGTPSISANINITTPTTTYPQSVPCLGSVNNLDAIDDRLFAAEIHKNKITGAITLWTAHHIETNSSGVGTIGGGRDASRWYEITNLTTAPSLNQSGTLFDNAASNPRYFWFPSVAMSGQGHMALGNSMAGTGRRAEISVAGRFRTDASGTIQSFTTAQTSTTAYNDGITNPQRWGDYSQTVVDPTDDMTMWTFQEYCDATNSWGVRAIQLKAPLPATPSSSNVTNIIVGQPSVNIIITGTSVSGSEFFDPGADAGGPGFANHIAASITGGVTVNSVTFNTPTQITLNISTVGATTGLKNITVTNPDGQSNTGNNLINILPQPTLNITGLIQGFYDVFTNLMVRDTVRVYLRNTSSPYAFVDSGKAYLTTSGTGSITFPNAANGVNYYLQIKHRNSIETWSSSPGQSFVSSVLNYDFTTASSQAFGNNMILKGTKYCIYNGNVIQDVIIDIEDLSSVYNDSKNSVSGYVNTDLTGDNFVDVADISIVYNNSINSVSVIIPPLSLEFGR